jgi:hypothetical protein
MAKTPYHRTYAFAAAGSGAFTRQSHPRIQLPHLFHGIPTSGIFYSMKYTFGLFVLCLASLSFAKELILVRTLTTLCQIFHDYVSLSMNH